ncbi:MAG: SDR family NAD(P)-dependent oxidoreductase, partial [Alphaproteobacteria bacterium]
LEGRAVLVTGASAGLGRHFAATLARAGARVAMAARRLDRLEELAREIRAEGGEVEPIRLDVTDRASVVDAIDKAEQAFGPLRALVNNAGIAKPQWITEITEADYDRIMDTNAKGMWLVAQEVGRRMIARGEGGQIVNIASMGGIIVTRQLAAYGMSKAAVIHMTKAMALEWARHEINVNAICPGYVSTEMNSYFFDSEEGRKFVSGFLRKRLMRAGDLDEILLLLVSGDSRALTGSIVTADDAQSFTLY